MTQGRSPCSRIPILITSGVDDLSPYDRATVGLWARSYEELTRQSRYGALVEAAVHAVLVGLRRHTEAKVLFTAYETEAAGDFALIRSLLAEERSEELLWMVRDAAFHLRWVELTNPG